MNPDAPRSSAQPDPPARPGLPIGTDPASVPAFGCIVYFAREGDVFRGRVANLAGIEVTAASQRELLGQIVAQFKSAVSDCLGRGETPAWIDPPAEKQAGESKLFLPVHL
ncbi:hypothetical protein [Stieleria mannarensis]|uniref:hypothetical protein n=1 Tax=Stieleria mannarensis TaxID=2755585 RepID=UPI0025710129|nr:hypothetical protein [Rhodopirellula sp. JC639]